MSKMLWGLLAQHCSGLFTVTSRSFFMFLHVLKNILEEITEMNLAFSALKASPLAPSWILLAVKLQKVQHKYYKGKDRANFCMEFYNYNNAVG